MSRSEPMYIPQKRSAAIRTEPSSQTIESTQKEEKKKEEQEPPKPFISTPLSMSFSFQPTQNSNGNTSGSAPGKTTDQPKTGSLSLFFS